MVQVDIPGAFTLGQIFAFVGGKLLKKEPGLTQNRLLGPFNIYFTIGFIPVGMFFMTGWPSWEVMYITGWVENTFNQPFVAGFYIAFMVVMILLGNAGFMLGHFWYRKGKDNFVIIGIIAGVILTLLPFLLRWGVWWKIGTFTEIQKGLGYSFFEPPFIFSWLFIMLYMVAATILGVFWMRHIVKNNL